MPTQQIFMEPPAMCQTLFLDCGNTVVIRTQISLTSWNSHSVASAENFNKLLSCLS